MSGAGKVAGIVYRNARPWKTRMLFGLSASQGVWWTTYSQLGDIIDVKPALKMSGFALWGIYHLAITFYHRRNVIHVEERDKRHLRFGFHTWYGGETFVNHQRWTIGRLDVREGSTTGSLKIQGTSGFHMLEDLTPERKQALRKINLL